MRIAAQYRVCDPHTAQARGVSAQFDGPFACICATYIVGVVFKRNKLQVHALKTTQLELYICSQQLTCLCRRDAMLAHDSFPRCIM
jgi:hypothetical protein